MKYLKFVVTSLLVFLVLPAYAERVSVNEVRELQSRMQSGLFSSRAEWNALTYYLQGVVEGAASYHEGAIGAGGTTLFCPPDGKGYSIEEIFTILDRAPEADANRPASSVILEGYAKRYPCD